MSFIRTLSRLIPDELYLKMMYYKHFHRFPDLKNPKTFNEKLQWLKLNDRRPEYTQMVDKYEAKKYVAGILGEEYIIRTIGVWNSANDIQWDLLPNQFVLKCNNDSGGIVICKDKASLNIQEAVSFLNRRSHKNGYWYGREWPYKNMIPRILAEQYMEDSLTHELRDYKFFTFDGKVKALFIASDRQTKGKETTFDFYDVNFQHLPLTNGHPNATKKLDKPNSFQLMIELAERLSKGIPHVRVDFYEVDGKPYFGEMTFSHWSGFVPFEPEEWDYTFGSWLNLPSSKKQ